jgi:hypothetical protein
VCPSPKPYVFGLGQLTRISAGWVGGSFRNSHGEVSLGNWPGPETVSCSGAGQSLQSLVILQDGWPDRHTAGILLAWLGV